MPSSTRPPISNEFINSSEDEETADEEFAKLSSPTLVDSSPVASSAATRAPEKKKRSYRKRGNKENEDRAYQSTHF